MTVTLGIFVLLHNVRKKNIFVVLISTIKQFEQDFQKIELEVCCYFKINTGMSNILVKSHCEWNRP